MLAEEMTSSVTRSDVELFVVVGIDSMPMARTGRNELLLHVVSSQTNVRVCPAGV